jgi:HD superfamily phosphohydrolase YqeK
LEGAFTRSISSKVHYLQGRGIPVHPRTLLAYRNLAGIQNFTTAERGDAA